VLPSLGCVRNALTFEEIAGGLVSAAQRDCSAVCDAALMLTDGCETRLPVRLPPAHSTNELLEVLQYGTIFLNEAAMSWKPAARIGLAASEALHFPVGVVAFVTAQGRAISTDAHTDDHDVIVLQSQGAKHWRIYPPPARRAGADPLRRGKDGDVLGPTELGDPLVDVVLLPGNVLLVPHGHPHTTSTCGTGDGTTAAESGIPSVHLSVCISAVSGDACLGALRRQVLSAARLGMIDAMVDVSHVPDEDLSDDACYRANNPAFPLCIHALG